MLFLGKPLDTIDKADIQNLITEKMREIKTIEYKRSLPTSSDASKKEFLTDTSSFANASGGFLIYGIEEVSGIPTKISGLDINPDTEILRLESIIMSGIAPRIPGISTRPIDMGNSKCVIIIGIPKSFASPHMIIFKNNSKFFSRNSNGKYQLDVNEIRAAFILSETTAEKIRNFRLERIGNIIADQTPVEVRKGAKIILHLIPFSSFSSNAIYDLSTIMQWGDPKLLKPLNWSYRDYRYNFDGLLTYSIPASKKPIPTYLQVFNNASIEVVDTILLEAVNGNKLIPSLQVHQSIIDAVTRFLTLENKLGVETPIIIMLSLINVQGYTLDLGPLKWSSGVPYESMLNGIERDTLLITEVIINDFRAHIPSTLKPIFDSISNACGLPGSIHYDKKGNWIS